MASSSPWRQAQGSLLAGAAAPRPHTALGPVRPRRCGCPLPLRPAPHRAARAIPRPSSGLLLLGVWRVRRPTCHSCRHPPQVAPNPELRGFIVTGANALPQARLARAYCRGVQLAYISLTAPFSGASVSRQVSCLFYPAYLCAVPCRAVLRCGAQAVIEDAFKDLHGRTLNFNSMVQVRATRTVSAAPRAVQLIHPRR